MADQRLPLAWQPVSPALMDALSPTTAYQDTERLRRYSSKVARDQHRSKVVDALLDTWPAQIAKSAWGAFTLPGDVYAGKVDPLSDEGVQRSADLAGFVTLGAGAIPAEANSARAGIKVYHGSPHDFDKFELSDKTIGTGEGARAYGHGLYFAENEGVAKGYKNNLTTMRLSRAQRQIDAFGGDADKAIAGLTAEIERLKSLPNGGGDYERQSRLIALKQEALDEIRKYVATGQMSTGRVYEAELDASPDDFLDWDKPLSEQSPKVRDILEGMGIDTKPRMVWTVKQTPKGWTVYTQWGEAAGTFKTEAAARAKASAATSKSDSGGGMWAYTSLGGNTAYPHLDKGKATERLRAAGIKGIRYKDAGSRTKEGGTSNYVVFDDNIINILRKYGIAGLIGGAAGAGAMTAQPGTAEARESR